MSAPPRVLGVLVAGGAGRRLEVPGGKALVRLGGTTLLERALATLGAVCDACVVAAPAAMSLPLPAAQRVADAAGGRGPLAGLAAGLNARPYERAIALGVDFPFMRPAALAALRDRLGSENALVPSPDGIPQPLAAVYAPAAGAALAAALERGARALIPAVLDLKPRLLGDAELEGLEGGLDNFFNLNTRDDLAAAERRVASAPRGGA
jgi:molybdopterin-guanine dinucleotide biosynthesis protein A